MAKGQGPRSIVLTGRIDSESDTLSFFPFFRVRTYPNELDNLRRNQGWWGRLLAHKKARKRI
ncbi:hypothetical protein TorRG33x02_140400 [Trema orientale]|uniref:Uncharacterized protein n=1 Tax=Trema orientale TaxID=63057 RepID=A0A2P5EXD5_TREOI|nr:hypothetical protein TorRG33x02_140400 [Trema orientale]